MVISLSVLRKSICKQNMVLLKLTFTMKYPTIKWFI